MHSLILDHDFLHLSLMLLLWLVRHCVVSSSCHGLCIDLMARVLANTMPNSSATPWWWWRLYLYRILTRISMLVRGHRWRVRVATSG